MSKHFKELQVGDRAICTMGGRAKTVIIADRKEVKTQSGVMFTIYPPYEKNDGWIDASWFTAVEKK